MHLGELFEQTARRNPEKPALICEGQTVTFAELDRTTAALAQWFFREGLKAGDRIAVQAQNTIAAATMFLACWRAGMIVVPVNARLKAAELAYILGHCNPAMYY